MKNYIVPRLAMLLLSLYALSSCTVTQPVSQLPCASPNSSVPAIAGLLDKPLELKVANQVGCFEKENIWIRVDSIPTDSRCPLDAACIWEGNAAISVSIGDAAGARQTLILNTNAAMMAQTTATFQAYTLQLAELLPANRVGIRIAQSDYRVRLVLTKRQK